MDMINDGSRSILSRISTMLEEAASMNNDRYERIRQALAIGPTPGPFLNRGETSRGVMLLAGLEDRKAIIYLYGPERWQYAHLIAACDPDTIRALLDERDALAAEVERLREALKGMETTHALPECV